MVVNHLLTGMILQVAIPEFSQAKTSSTPPLGTPSWKILIPNTQAGGRSGRFT